MPFLPRLTPVACLSAIVLAASGCSTGETATPPEASPTPPTAIAEVPKQQETTVPPTPTATSGVSKQQATDDPGALVGSFCGDRGLKVEQYFETANYHIYLCYDNSNQIFYNGVNKRNGSAITLPAYTEEGTGYVAENDEYTYIVTGASLEVSKNGKPILEETVLRSL